jgi:hypothetical protein
MGKTAGMQLTAAGVGTQPYDPKNEDACTLHDGNPANGETGETWARGAACCCAARCSAAT